LPESISQLSQLTVLLLTNNPISALPATFGQHMPELRELTLRFTNITELSSALVCATKLQVHPRVALVY
jgi:Leucine-rich repeat (LRR) protein